MDDLVLVKALGENDFTDGYTHGIFSSLDTFFYSLFEYKPRQNIHYDIRYVSVDNPLFNAEDSDTYMVVKCNLNKPINDEKPIFYSVYLPPTKSSDDMLPKSQFLYVCKDSTQYMYNI